MDDQTIQEIELNIAEAMKMVALGKSLDRLLSNRDFKKIIQEEYLKENAIRLVHLKADPSRQSEECQESIVKQMDGIGSLVSFLREVEHRGYLAEKAIADDEETIDELRAEGLE